MKPVAAAVLAALALAACATTPSEPSNGGTAYSEDASTDAAMVAVVYPVMVVQDMLTDPEGMTLYVLDTDVAGEGKSSCTGACAKEWPPLVAVAEAVPVEDYTVVMRDDGTKQWAHKGKPLYHSAKDEERGHRRGDNAGGRWHVATP
jgi:predicted lipoprotein with Yx(FWY)xxD motif